MQVGMPRLQWLLAGLFSLLVWGAGFAQAPHACVVLLKDKAGNGCTISEPERFLSDYAVEKRRRFHIPVTEPDLPISPAYLDTLSRLDSGCFVLTTSKWFNYVVIGTNDSV